MVDWALMLRNQRVPMYQTGFSFLSIKVAPYSRRCDANLGKMSLLNLL